MQPFIVLAIVFTGTSVVSATQHCMTDAECGQDECCFRHEGPLIVSRRQLGSYLPVHSNNGVCEKYLVKGDHCSVFAKLNGHCSCGPNLHCDFVPAEVLTLPTAILQTVNHLEPLAVSRKRSVYYPGPGSYQCVPKA